MGMLRSRTESSQSRRGRKLSRVVRRRCYIWIFLLSIMFLAYLSLVGPATLHEEKEPPQVPGFHSSGKHSHGGNDTGTAANTIWHPTRIQFVNISKVKSHKRHGPCEVAFNKSVEYMVKPENYMNFTKFSLDYVVQEQRHYINNHLLQPKFGGYQTLEERENSYRASNQRIHCGFVTGPAGYPSTGFDVNEKDKEYMARCRVAVSSCIFEGNVPDDEGYIGLWKIVLVKKPPYTDMRKTGKVPKFLAHRLFPSAWYSIWIDSKMRLQTDPMSILEFFLWRTKSEYAISNHYDRQCVWDEVVQNKRLNKYNHSAIDEQFQFYQSDGLVKFNESDLSAPLPSYVPEGSFIVRAHTPMSNLFSCLWFNEVDRFTSRDQLSFAYTFLKLRRMNAGKPFFLHMFKDCERRAMAKIFHHRVENT